MAIEYPNPITDIALLGKPAAWQRRLLLDPRRAGRYSVLAWPTHALELRLVLRIDVEVRAGQGAPTPVLLRIPEPLRAFEEWSWRLVRWPSALRPEQLDVARPEEPRRPSRFARPRGMELRPRPSISALLFEEEPVLEGSFTLEEDRGGAPHRLVVWSCNQPYATDESGKATLNPEMPAALEWAEHRIEEFDPHVVWGLGDTAYADGTEATNFVDE